jgi:hypothetical protein
MAGGIYAADSDWFLYLLDRVAHGDALYSDRFFGVMPLSVWAGLPGVILIGPQIAVVKGMYAASSAAAATLAAYAARRLGVGRAGQGLVLLASVAYLFMPSYAPYKPMAYAAQVGALAAMSAWLGASGRGGGDRALLLAGVAVGISVASKHTVGALTLAACLLVVWLARGGKEVGARARLRDTGVLLAPAIAIPVLSLVPILIAGDLGDFWRYAITKGEYVERGSVSYLSGFEAIPDVWGLPPSNLHLALFLLGIVATPLALLALAITVRRQGEWLLLASFTAAAILSSYPRADLLIAIPVLSVALAWSIRELAGSRVGLVPARVALGSLALLLAATAYATLLRNVQVDIREGFPIGAIKNHAGVPVPPEEARATGEVGGELAAVDGGENGTFVLSPYAGYLYLASGLTDPTRQDYPYASTFRSGDLQDLERRLASGEIPRVCLGPYKGSGRLRPAALESFVRSHLRRSVRVGPLADTAFGYLGCRIYLPG